MRISGTLRQGTLNAPQIDLVHQLRMGLMAIAMQENDIKDVKVLSPANQASP